MTTTMKAGTHLMALAVAVAVLASCGGDNGTEPPTNNGNNSSFTATLAGAVTGSFSGKAVYGSASQGGFGLGLAPAGSQGVAIVFARNGGTPSAQQYTLADLSGGSNPDASQFAAYVSVATSSFTGALFGKSGTLTITDAGGGRLKGTFQFTAAGVTAGGSQQVEATVSGSFDAVNGTVTIP